MPMRSNRYDLFDQLKSKFKLEDMGDDPPAVQGTIVPVVNVDPLTREPWAVTGTLDLSGAAAYVSLWAASDSAALFVYEVLMMRLTGTTGNGALAMHWATDLPSPQQTLDARLTVNDTSEKVLLFSPLLRISGQQGIGAFSTGNGADSARGMSAAGWRYSTA